MTSLRTRLLLGVLGTTALLLALLCLSIYAVIRTQWLGQFDRQLLAVARLVAASVEADDQDAELELPVETSSGPFRRDHPVVFEIRRGDVIIARTHQSDDVPLPEVTVRGASVTFKRTRLPAGSRIHAVAFRFLPREERGHQDPETPAEANDIEAPGDSPGWLTLVAAADADDVYDHLEVLATTLLGSFLAVLVLAVVTTMGVVRRSLAPVRRLAACIEAIEPDNLGQRLASPVPDELTPVVSGLNGLLERLQAAFVREKRFTADVAHELRTPLAALRSTLEVTLSKPRDAACYRETLSECLRLATGQQAMVETLMALARNSHPDVSKQVVCPARLVEQLCSEFGDAVFDRHLTVENDLDPAWTLETDPVCLTTILRNALDNAVSYAAPGSWIRLSAVTEERSVALEIANNGCGLTDDQVEHLFEPFWRADSARSDAGRHCGLGLALVRRLCQRLGATVTARVDGDVFILHIAWPSSQPPR